MSCGNKIEEGCVGYDECEGCECDEECGCTIREGPGHMVPCAGDELTSFDMSTALSSMNTKTVWDFVTEIPIDPRNPTPHMLNYDFLALG